MSIILDEVVTAAWQKWTRVNQSRCHLDYTLVGGSLEKHIPTCYDASLATASRIERDLEGALPRTILEVGCSAGFNCLALARQFPDAMVYGIEPDFEAVELGQTMAAQSGFDNVRLIHGVGEGLPFPDQMFDLIVCHTVIEHVHNVSSVIAEMARVVSQNGVIHLDAPNYLWPREPHIDVWCFPLLGKAMVRFFAKLQGKAHRLWYLEHLQFVYPTMLERFFAQYGLVWHNRVEEKILGVLHGNVASVHEYHLLGKALEILNKAGVGVFLSRMALKLGVYPSVMYTLRRQVAPPVCF